MGGGASTNVHNQENKPMKDLGPEFECRLITKINNAKDGLCCTSLHYLFIFLASFANECSLLIYVDCATAVILRVDPESLSLLDPSHKVTLIPIITVPQFWMRSVNRAREDRKAFYCGSAVPHWLYAASNRKRDMSCSSAEMALKNYNCYLCMFRATHTPHSCVDRHVFSY